MRAKKIAISLKSDITDDKTVPLRQDELLRVTASVQKLEVVLQGTTG